MRHGKRVMAPGPSFVVVAQTRVDSLALLRALHGAGFAVAGEIFHDDVRTRDEAAAGLTRPYVDGEDGAKYLGEVFGPSGESRGFALLYTQARRGPAATSWA